MAETNLIGNDSEFIELPCPGCNAQLGESEEFERLRICPTCGRHFPLPPREHVALIVDPDGFSETNAALLSLDPLLFHDYLPYQDRLAEAQELLAPPGFTEGAITGVGLIDNRAVMLIVLDLAALGGTIGALAGEKITLALEHATTDRLPVVAICSGGRGRERAHEGMLALLQIAKIANAAANLRRAGLPFISVLTHPTTGGAYVGLANQADVILAEPGAWIGFWLSTDHGAPSNAEETSTNTAEEMMGQGFIDAVVSRDRERETISAILAAASARGPARRDNQSLEIEAANVSPSWDGGPLVRHPDRPSGRDYIGMMLDGFVELRGDRTIGDDSALVCGLGLLAGQGVAVVAQDRRATNADGTAILGRVRTTGFRKADRVMRLAARLELPIVILIDAPGQAGGLSPESDGIGVALAHALSRFSLLPTPVVTAIIGEAGGIDALALGAGDRTLMHEHAVYTVPGADGTSIAARAASRFAPQSSHTVSAKECLRLGVIDQIIPEPGSGAHTNPADAARLLQAALVDAVIDLSALGSRRLLAERDRRRRTLGLSTPEARAATRREAMAQLDLQDLPRHLVRSLGEWRDRIESRYRGAARRGRPQIHLSRPHLPERISILRANVAAAVTRPGHDAGGARPSDPEAREVDRQETHPSEELPGLSGRAPE